MEGMDAVLEPVETGSDVEIEQPESGIETIEVEQPVEKDEPYSSKYSREMSAALKQLRDAHPEQSKFLRQAKDDHSRLYQLHQMEPRGIDGIRETYALLDSVVHGDLKGTQAIAALQDAVQSVSQLDERIVAGDPTALDSFDDSMKAGIVRLAPAILDMARDMDPDGYSSAVLPHFVDALKQSDLVKDFNSMVDVLTEQPPSWLTENQKAQWTADRLQRITAHAGRMGQWFNAQLDKVKGLKPGEAKPGTSRTGQKDSLSEDRQKFETEQQTHHWKTNIYPGLDKHSDTKFAELFRPFAKRLRLDAAATGALRSEFAQRVVKQANGSQAYRQQIDRYHSQKNPDPKTVLNYATVEFDKHAKSVMETLINERYKSFLSGKPKPGTTNGNGARPAGGAVAPGVEIRNVKPAFSEIDHKNTPLEWLHQKKYRMLNGKIVQVRSNA